MKESRRRKDDRVAKQHSVLRSI